MQFTARQGLERHPGEAAADIFVGGRRLTQEAHVPPTKIQPVQDGYSGKPARPPKLDIAQARQARLAAQKQIQ